MQCERFRARSVEHAAHPKDVHGARAISAHSRSLGPTITSPVKSCLLPLKIWNLRNFLFITKKNSTSHWKSKVIRHFKLALCRLLFQEIKVLMFTIGKLIIDIINIIDMYIYVL